MSAMSGRVAQLLILLSQLAQGGSWSIHTMDEHMSYRQHRVPPLQKTQGRGTHSRVIGEEIKTEGRATRPLIADIHEKETYK